MRDLTKSSENEEEAALDQEHERGLPLSRERNPNKMHSSYVIVSTEILPPDTADLITHCGGKRKSGIVPEE